MITFRHVASLSSTAYVSSHLISSHLISPRFISFHHISLSALQCAVRRRRSKIILRSRKAAAKDLGKLQHSNESLKLEIEQLRARAKDETRRVLVEAEER